MKTTTKKYAWQLKDIIMIGILGVLFALIYLGAFYLSMGLQAALTPFGLAPFNFEIVYGVWFMAATVAAFIMQKPGVAFVTEVLAAFLELLMGNFPLVITTGLVQGVGLELGFAVFRYRRYDMASMCVSATFACILKMCIRDRQQMIEIAKAISLNADILIMDEPTAALTNTEIDDLFRFVRDLKAKDVGIVYISHRMEELKVITDDITVMRDGQYVGTVRTEDTEMDEIISMMVGRTIYEEPKTHSAVPAGAPTVLRVEHLSSPVVHDVSFELKKGEILGFAGLMGAGRTETARLIFGADPRTEGRIFVSGKEVSIESPQDAVESGIGYLSEDRKAFGLAVGLSVADNTVMATMDEFVQGGVVNESKIAKVTREYVQKLDLKTPSIKQLVRNLSGGNQQKVVIAKWLVRNCDILIFDEPTRGIDVGAKSEIYKLMNQLAAEGKSIIMISSEMPELLRMSDRVLVMCEGKMTGEIDISEATQEGIMKYATQRS